MEDIQKFVENHCGVIVVALIIIMILIIIVFGLGIGLASKAEQMKLPWKNKSEHLDIGSVVGGLTPAESVMLNQKLRADPLNSQHAALMARKSEYMNNKAEAPTLIAKLYQ